MQRKTGTEVELDKAVSLFDSIGASSAIDRSASNYLNAAEKEQKIRKLISTGTYDADIVKYIPGTLDLIYQGMLIYQGRHKRTTSLPLIQRHGKSWL